MTAEQILNREFLELRCKFLELAAALDRLDRAEGDVTNDARWRKLQQAAALLIDGSGSRAERLQLLFSREYSDNWRDAFGLAAPRS